MWTKFLWFSVGRNAATYCGSDLQIMAFMMTAMSLKLSLLHYIFQTKVLLLSLVDDRMGIHLRFLLLNFTIALLLDTLTRRR